MRDVEAILTFGMSGWPVWVHHADRDLSWRVLEVMEPQIAPGGASVQRYVLKVHGPLAYLTGRDGTFYIATERQGDQWRIEPDPTAYPRRGTAPGELGSNVATRNDQRLSSRSPQ